MSHSVPEKVSMLTVLPLGRLDEQFVLDTAGEGGDITAQQYALCRRQGAISSADERCRTLDCAAVHLQSMGRQGHQAVERLHEQVSGRGLAATSLQWAGLALVCKVHSP